MVDKLKVATFKFFEVIDIVRESLQVELLKHHNSQELNIALCATDLVALQLKNNEPRKTAPPHCLYQ